MPLAALTVEEINNLDLPSLVARMDAFREQAEEEQHGRLFLDLPPSPFPFPMVGQVMKTKKVSIQGEVVQRRIADATFRFLLQLDLLMVSSGITNRVVYGPQYSDDHWASPLHWMKSAVLAQYQIIGSRIALECFFDLMHLVDRGTRMQGNSKFSAFRKWVLEDGNPFSYFVGHIVKAFAFDRDHRQKEVHGTSRFARAMLTLQMPDSEEQNLPLQLTNVMRSVWYPFIEILDGRKPNSIAVFDGTDNFAKHYFESHEDQDGFAQFLRELIADKMTRPRLAL